MESRNIRLAVIPGDGIGTEVVAEGLKVLEAVGTKIEPTHYDLGAARYHRTGETLPDSVLEELRGFDAILLGAIGDPSVPPGILERDLLLRLRFTFDHYVNLRPVKLFPGVETPLADTPTEDIDMIVVREGTEGLYAGDRRGHAAGHAARDRHPGVAQHRPRRRARGALRVRAGQVAAAQEAHARPQDERAVLQPATCGSARSTGWPRNTPRSPPTTATSTRPRCSSSPSPSAST